MTDASESAKSVVVGAIDALNAGDLDGYFARHTGDTTLHSAGRTATQDATQYREELSAFCARHPDLRVTPRRLVCEDDTVVMESTLQLDASDEPHAEVVVFDLDGDRIAETTVYSRLTLAERARSERA